MNINITKCSRWKSFHWLANVLMSMKLAWKWNVQYYFWKLRPKCCQVEEKLAKSCSSLRTKVTAFNLTKLAHRIVYENTEEDKIQSASRILCTLTFFYSSHKGIREDPFSRGSRNIKAIERRCGNGNGRDDFRSASEQHYFAEGVSTTVIRDVREVPVLPVSRAHTVHDWADRTAYRVNCTSTRIRGSCWNADIP